MNTNALNANALDDPRSFAHLDREGMRTLLRAFPEQLKQAWDLATQAQAQAHLELEGPQLKGVAVCGMGGSAIGGDLLRTYLQPKLKKPMAVVRDYELPPFIDAQWLVFAVSYSGNTEETVSCAQEALRRGCPLIAVTSGGKLNALARERGVPWIEIPGGMPPRTALAFLFIPLLRTLLFALDDETHKKIKREFQEALAQAEEQAGHYDAAPEAENPAKQRAKALFERIPVIYGSALTGAVARRWKCQINENAKQPAYWDVLPELHHNEIMGWEWESPLTERFVYVLLRDPEEHPQIQKRFRITRALLEERGRAVLEVRPPEESRGPLARLLALSYLGDWVSYYLALLNGVDPTPVTLIETMKRRLAQG